MTRDRVIKSRLDQETYDQLVEALEIRQAQGLTATLSTLVYDAVRQYLKNTKQTTSKKKS